MISLAIIIMKLFSFFLDDTVYVEHQVLLVTGGEPLYSTEVIVWENIENIGIAVPGPYLL